MVYMWSMLLSIVFAINLVHSSPSQALPRAQTLDTPTDSDRNWTTYVRAPPSKSVEPATVLSEYTVGNVSNADALVGSGSGPTVLSRSTLEEQAPELVLDFGINVVGQLAIGFAASANATEGFPGIKLAFSETLQFLSNTSDFTRSQSAGGSDKLTAGTDQIAVKPEPYTWIDQLGCEYDTKVCADGLHGFRYVKITFAALDKDAPYTSSLGSISISSIRLLFSAFLGTADTFTGNFECSDTALTQWWYDAVYTNDLCTDTFRANDTEPRNALSPSLIGKLVLHDGAKRDRDPYVGDLAVSALTTYLSHDLAEAALNVLEDLALHQRDDGWIPPASIANYTLPLFDYPLWWVVSSVDYVMYTGNTTFWETYFPVITKAIDGYYVAHTNNETSLIERPGGAGDFAFISRTGAVTYYNALYVHALNYAARVAEAVGNSADAQRWKERADTVGRALIKRNFDTSAGAFYDGGSCSEIEMCPTHAQDGNSIAILSGAVPSGMSPNTTMAEAILAYMNKTMARPYGNAFYDNDRVGSGYSDRVYAFISYFEIAARFETSFKQPQGALEEIGRLYGWMSAHGPNVTAWEGIGKDGAPYEAGFTSMAHGWSTGIVPLMSNYVLGVKPEAPGFKRWSVSPAIDNIDLAWARGVVPTPSGGISVQWEKSSGSDGVGYTLSIDAPVGTNGTVILALRPGQESSVAVNGAVLFQSSDGGATSLVVEGGRYTIDVTYT